MQALANAIPLQLFRSAAAANGPARTAAPRVSQR
jgi:hypothetical protein